MRTGTPVEIPADWRQALKAETQRLLGDTIALSDGEWQTATGLVGWARFHVATHLACHAVALASLVTTVARSRHPQPWAIQPADDCLRTCAGLDAIALQERLDESSAQLMTALDLMDEATWEIELKSNGDKYPAKAIILDRLNEVVVHHVDLHLGFDFADVESSLLRALLVWNLTRALPRLAGVELRVDSDEGFSCRVGTGKVVTVRGTEGNIMAWLTGRKGASSVLGAEELSLWGPV